MMKIQENLLSDTVEMQTESMVSLTTFPDVTDPDFDARDVYQKVLPHDGFTQYQRIIPQTMSEVLSG